MKVPPTWLAVFFLFDWIWLWNVFFYSLVPKRFLAFCASAQEIKNNNKEQELNLIDFFSISSFFSLHSPKKNHKREREGERRSQWKATTTTRL